MHIFVVVAVACENILGGDGGAVEEVSTWIHMRRLRANVISSPRCPFCSSFSYLSNHA